MSKKDTPRLRRKDSRVQITYPEGTGAAQKRVEVPFLAAPLADLAGDQTDRFDERGHPVGMDDVHVLPVTSKSTDDLLRHVRPYVDLEIPSRAKDGSAAAGAGKMLKVRVNFERMIDFEPDQLAANVEALKPERRLSQALGELETYCRGVEMEDYLLDLIRAATEMTAGDEPAR